jgi:ATP-binding cassette subfamily B multidrug efflux pump
MFRFFETLVAPTATAPDAAPPPGLWPFYWHFMRQTKGLFVALFATGLGVALCDAMIPLFIGRIVTLVSTHPPDALWPVAGWELAGMALVILLIRPFAIFMQNLVSNQAIVVNVTNLIRWQSHWHVVRQSWAFFQNDFAGRIANRVLQTGSALRESVVVTINAVWYIAVYGTSAMLLLASVDLRLAAPLALWVAIYVSILRYFVPRMRDQSRKVSDARSQLSGRIVDSYTNILTVKLFARSRDEDAYVRDAVDDHGAKFKKQQRLTTLFTLCLTTTNAALVASTAAIAIWLWLEGKVAPGAIAMALPLTWQIVNIAGWVAQNVTGIFENIGIVQEGTGSIAVPHQLVDVPDAKPLEVTRGEIRFDAVTFGYGRDVGVLHDLLLRFFEPEQGRILIDGQDIAEVTQESLRAQIAMVTQDTSLLHRSIRDNIRYGKPEATDEEIAAAARRAHAEDFIPDLEDLYKRRGYDAFVGERGVKLSGGQRQRIALARVILKNAALLARGGIYARLWRRQSGGFIDETLADEVG